MKSINAGNLFHVIKLFFQATAFNLTVMIIDLQGRDRRSFTILDKQKDEFSLMPETFFHYISFTKQKSTRKSRGENISSN